MEIIIQIIIIIIIIIINDNNNYADYRKNTTGKVHYMNVSLICITKRHNFFNSFTFSVFINCLNFKVFG